MCLTGLDFISSFGFYGMTNFNACLHGIIVGIFEEEIQSTADTIRDT